MADFEIAYGETELREGGYVNDPVDRGGETCRGVARKFHESWPGWMLVDRIKTDHPQDFVRRINDSPEIAELAKQFFRKQFWNPIRGDELPNQHLANKVFDTAVNQGVGSSVRYLQEALNMLNRNQQNYPDIAVDGKLGAETLQTIKLFLELEQGRPDYLLKLLNLMQAFRYVEIMRRDPTQERFARGWLNRVDLK
jgi:lysozyme family protein